MNLAIDVGNTFIKTAVFEGGKILEDYKLERKLFLKGIEKIFHQYPDISHAILSSVRNLTPREQKALSVFCKIHILSNSSVIPFKNNYTTPQTLGVDRIALITAAFYENAHKNTLIIDAGTCITYDFLSSDGTYYGGAISPGINMRFKALNTFTAKLPLVEFDTLDDFIGNSTHRSIISGVINGTINEIEGVIGQYSKRFKDLTLILTGGDSEFLSNRLKNSIFANSNFLLIGLNYILELNKY
ncbi:type III pantothenate kinase [Abyssalbus ytuae]|uniref:Type III pantothenate kinase n=1 Tax=Abyssalbus ytuae TaxID=2926907 RepID=A0A9E6ZVV8_9FLAO|nr:type III pantothenate kinase [Abyssalbus ytuae]UOB18733.1 type III pantothenate kinase [Abyssalbus ytuae]